MNKTVKKFFVGWRQFYACIASGKPGFTHSTCGSFTKQRERIKTSKKNVI